MKICRPQLRNAYCGKYSGAAGTSGTDTLTQISGKTTIEVVYRQDADPTTGVDTIFGALGSSKRYWAFISSGVVSFGYGTDATTTGDIIEPDVWYKYRSEGGILTISNFLTGAVVGTVDKSGNYFTDVIDQTMTIAEMNRASGDPNLAEGSFAYVSMQDDTVDSKWVFSSGEGDKIYDVISGNHIDINSTGFTWAKDCDDFHYNYTDGYSLYEHATSDPILIPYDTDGNPLSITPPTGYTKTSDNPGGVFHNGAESDFIQTDTVNGDLLTRSLFSTDGLTFDEVSMAAFESHISGTDNIWIKWHPTKRAIIELCVYQSSYVLTAAKYPQFVAYFTQGVYGGGVVPSP